MSLKVFQHGLYNLIDGTDVVMQLAKRKYPEIMKLPVAVRIDSTNGKTYGVVSLYNYFSNGINEEEYQVNCQINPDAAPTTDSAKAFLTAIVAHEFSHLALNHHRPGRVMSYLMRFDRIHQLRTSYVEKATDRDVIKRGLGSDLLEFTEWCESVGANNKNYLSSNEIKELL